MKTSTKILASIFAIGVLAGCQDDTVKEIQAKRGAEIANSIDFAENAEQKQLEKRLRQTGRPGLVGYIILLNDAGQPIFYGSVDGKVTSGGKRLTRPDEIYSGGLRAAPSDEGTFGSSSPYIFFWTTEGEYMQWSGQYLYSDKPLRLRVEPLVISVTPPEAK